MHLLEEKGFSVEGLDLSPSMLNIASSRTKGTLYNGNLLDFKIKKQYDVIISMFAVFNHLKSYQEFEQGILHWYKHLNKDGLLIIDLHNGRQSGQKESVNKDYKRIMKWSFNQDTFKEHTEIEYIINNHSYNDTHEFIIYEIDKIKKILDKNNLSYKLYENYSFNNATDTSKNIEIIIKK